MNNQRRNRIARAISQLEEKKSYIEDILSDEQNCLDNMPENLQNGESCSAMKEAVCSIDEAIEHLKSAQDFTKLKKAYSEE